MVLPSVGTIVAGVATTRAGIEMIGNGESITNKILLDSIAYSSQPRSVGGSEANSHGYVLTPRALQAIAKSWDIAPYSPLETNVPHWLEELQGFCELYGVPVTQRPLCVMHHMGTDREAAHAVGCHDMTRDQFTTWLLKYDGACLISKVLLHGTDIANSISKKEILPSLTFSRASFHLRNLYAHSVAISVFHVERIQSCHGSFSIAPLVSSSEKALAPILQSGPLVTSTAAPRRYLSLTLDYAVYINDKIHVECSSPAKTQ